MFRRLRAIWRDKWNGPAFHYDDRVEIVGGFYKGRKGVVLDYGDFMQANKYTVLLDGKTYTESLYPDQLQLESA